MGNKESLVRRSEVEQTVKSFQKLITDLLKFHSHMHPTIIRLISSCSDISVMGTNLLMEQLTEVSNGADKALLSEELNNFQKFGATNKISEDHLILSLERVFSRFEKWSSDFDIYDKSDNVAKRDADFKRIKLTFIIKALNFLGVSRSEQAIQKLLN